MDQPILTLATTPPLAAALIAAEWLVRGPEALRILAGGDSDIVAAEAQIISTFNPSAPVTPAEGAVDITTRFSFWVTGGMILTTLHRAAQRRIAAQTTPEVCLDARRTLRLRRRSGHPRQSLFRYNGASIRCEAVSPDFVIAQPQKAKIFIA